MQALSRREETEVIELVKKEALRECDQLVRGVSPYTYHTSFADVSQSLPSVPEAGQFPSHGLARTS